MDQLLRKRRELLNDLGEEDKSSVSEDYSRNERLDKFGMESTIEV
jgi:hypothetical protein